MLKRLLFSIPVRIAGVVVLLYLLWQVVVFLQPRPADFSDTDAAYLRGAALDAAATLSRRFPGGEAALRVGIVHLSNDPYGTATALLTEAIESRDPFEVDRTSVVRRFLQDTGEALLQATSIEEVMTAGRTVNLDLLVMGRVEESVADFDPPRLTLKVFDLRPGGTRSTLEGIGFLPSGEAEGFPGAGGNPAAAGGWNTWRWFLAALIMAALPWLTPFFTRFALTRKSNVASACLLGGYLVADLLLLALAAGGMSIKGWALAWVALAAAVLMVYNTWSCEIMAARQE